jgi:hypothetical protein
MFKLYYIAFIGMLLYSCKTATKAFEKGNYEDAVELAVKKLQKDPSNAEMHAIVKNAYAAVVNKHEANISLYSGSNGDTKYEKIYNEYRKLQDVSDLVRRTPALANVVGASDYSSYVQTYKQKTGQVYFERGLALMERGDKASFRQAYNELRNAYRYKNDSEVKTKMDEAYNAAVTRVLIVTNDNYGTYNNGMYGNGMYGSNYNNYNMSYKLRNFQDELVRNLKFQSNDQFVQFYTEWDARSNNITPDETLEMRLGNLNIGRSYDNTYSRNVSKEIVVREIVYKPDSVVRQYATVSATVNVTRRTYVSEGDLIVSSRDASGRYLWNDMVRADQSWQTEFASYTGDQRALSASDLALINNSGNYGYNQTRQENIIDELLRQLQNDALNRFRSYYSRYY